MPESVERILKLVCLVLAVLLLAQLAGVASRLHPLRGASIPELPRWSPPVSNIVATAESPARPGMNRNPALPPGQGAPPLPAALQARIDKITQSGLLGPVIRPPPMALLGIVGRDVLLRAPDGQSGLVREGGELGGVQLLRIGTNRVLVRENGVEKELLIFGGLGGESLLSQKGNP